MTDFLVRIDDKLWADFFGKSAFASDEEAIRHLLTMAFYQGDPSGITSKLIHATGKIRVSKVPSSATSDRIRAILAEGPGGPEPGSGAYRLPSNPPVSPPE